MSAHTSNQAAIEWCYCSQVMASRRAISEHLKGFWVRLMALEKRNYRQVVDTAVDIGQKVGASEIQVRVVKELGKRML